MPSHEFEFTYDSNRLAEIKNSESCIKVKVTVGYDTFYAHNYDTPFGADPKKLCVGLRNIEEVFAEKFGDVKLIMDDDIDFMSEIVEQLETERMETKMIEHALKDID